MVDPDQYDIRLNTKSDEALIERAQDATLITCLTVLMYWVVHFGEEYGFLLTVGAIFELEKFCDDV